MNETAETPALNEALAKFQAALPRVTKGEQADVPGKDGKRGYSYKYADLADISQAVLPMLGQFGLAFTAKPTTLENGAFVLHYKLTHSSGEKDEGFYLLPSPDRTGPQQVGSAITYARRYCLCAVTGIHPDGEDDDGASAQQAATTAGAAWETATPARPANGNGHANGRAQKADAFPADTDEAWLAEAPALASTFADDAAGRVLWAKIIAKRDAQEIPRADAARLQDLVRGRWKELTEAAQAVEGTIVSPLAADDEWTLKIEELDGPAAVEAAETEVRDAVKAGHMTQERGDAILLAIAARSERLVSA